MTRFHLGLSTSGHDPALAIVDAAGRLVFAEATERFVQDKRAWGIAPDHINHLSAALKSVGFDAGSDTLCVATTWKETKAKLPVQVSGSFLPVSDGNWLRTLQAGMQSVAGASLMRLGLSLQKPEPRRYDHHLCHAVAACAFAPVDDAACLVIDGEGEVGAASFFDLRDRTLKRRWRSWGPGSLGTFYAWLTHLCGFDWRLGEEWKVMGLAAYGRVQPEIRDALLAVMSVDRGRLRFADDTALKPLIDRLTSYARAPGADLMTVADLAASGQAAYGSLADQVIAACSDGTTGNLILSGGCALNSSYNGTLVGRMPFDHLFVPPAPADDGNAIGAALLSWMETRDCSQIPIISGTPYLGSKPNHGTISKIAQGTGVTRIRDIANDSAAQIAHCLADGKIIGVMRGQAEFGPRALGHRSILADPRAADMKDRINREVKGREPYRPFAPVIPEELVGDWFERAQSSPYMSITLPWRADKSALVPAVVHEDGTGRLQTVSPQSAPWMHRLTREFGALTDVPIVLNTSFNIMGKPIIHSAEDALAVFMTTGMDALLLENTLIEK